jgi:hypothetical protein
MNAQDKRQFPERYLEALEAGVGDALDRFVVHGSFNDHSRVFPSAFPGGHNQPITLFARATGSFMACFRRPGPLLSIAPTRKATSVPFTLLSTKGEEVAGHQSVSNEIARLRRPGALPVVIPAWQQTTCLTNPGPGRRAVHPHGQ